MTERDEWLDLDNAPGHLIRRVQQLHNLLWSLHVSSTHTPVQFATLNALSRSGPMDQVTLAARVHTDPSTTTELVNRMYVQGLIERTRSTTDGRRKVLSLTEQGREILRELLPKVRRLQPLLERSLSADESEQLHGLLRKLLEGRA
ncbi:MarR family winged helix-turn-helix transcriptional regulator [Allonocardiopsis opalescens]|uniref:MarR family transcriptional regulator n=1 Tax=Allonocardiopsis opalescens TaxID=1144618 RepID=A0A2T0Q0I8_9ACTN|nr:MarR family transcriptional regulator [Allonocardiopsis opalescens]PRX97300.1 MarR family transcriptional regulator [Allonocardiopsis opalescens]